MEGRGENKAETLKPNNRPPRILLPGIQEIAKRRKKDEEGVVTQKQSDNSER